MTYVLLPGEFLGAWSVWVVHGEARNEPTFGLNLEEKNRAAANLEINFSRRTERPRVPGWGLRNSAKQHTHSTGRAERIMMRMLAACVVGVSTG